jgi:hypothetical protein
MRIRGWSGSHGCAGTQVSSLHRGRSVPGDAESGSLDLREDARAPLGGAGDEACGLRPLPGECGSQTSDRRPVRVLRERRGNPQLGEWLPRTGAMNRATPGQVSTATPRRGIKLPGADAKREVRSRCDSQVARAEPYAKSRALATVTQAIEAGRCRKLAGIAAISTSARFAQNRLVRATSELIAHEPTGRSDA